MERYIFMSGLLTFVTENDNHRHHGNALYGGMIMLYDL